MMFPTMWRRWFMISVGALGSLAFCWHLARNGSELFYERRELRRVEQRVASMKDRIATLDHERDRLKNDMTYVETIARDDLGMVKPGEIVYYFPANP